MGEKIISAVICFVVAFFAVGNTIDAIRGEYGGVIIFWSIVILACWLYAQLTKKNKINFGMLGKYSSIFFKYKNF